MNFPVWVWPSLQLEVLNNLDQYPDIHILGRNLLQIELYTETHVDYSTLAHLIIRMANDLKMNSERLSIVNHE